MFENLSVTDAELIYIALKGLIETKSGHDLHNCDGHHPVYITGSQGELREELEYADSPDKSTLFKMLSELSAKLKEGDIESHGFTWWYDFKDWQTYCKFVVDSYRR